MKGEGSGSDDDEPRGGRPCLQCRKSKVLCNKEMPCQRCVSHGIECTVQGVSNRGKVRGIPGVRKKGVGKPKKNANGKKPPVSKATTKNQRSDGQHAAFKGTAARSLVVRTPKEEGVPRNLEAWAVTDVNRTRDALIASFLTLKSQGKLDLGRVVSGIMHFETISYRHGRDVSLGVMAMMRSVMEEEMPLPCIPVGPDPDVEPGLPVPANKEDLLVDARKYLPQYVKEMLAASPAVLVMVHWGSYVHCITNAKFSETFLSADELNSCLERGLGSQYLWSRVVATDDIGYFMERLDRLIWCGEGAGSALELITNCRDREGAKLLALLRLRFSIVIPKHFAVGVLCAMPLPASRHLRLTECSGSQQASADASVASSSASTRSDTPAPLSGPTTPSLTYTSPAATTMYDPVLLPREAAPPPLLPPMGIPIPPTYDPPLPRAAPAPHFVPVMRPPYPSPCDPPMPRAAAASPLLPPIDPPNQGECPRAPPFNPLPNGPQYPSWNVPEHRAPPEELQWPTWDVPEGGMQTESYQQSPAGASSDKPQAVFHHPYIGWQQNSISR